MTEGGTAVVFRKGCDLTPWDERVHAGHLVTEEWEEIFDEEASAGDCGSFAAKEAVRSLCSDWRCHVRDGWTLERLIEEDGQAMHEALECFFDALRERMREYRAKKFGERLSEKKKEGGA